MIALVSWLGLSQALLQAHSDSFSHRECEQWKGHCLGHLPPYLCHCRKSRRCREWGQSGNVPSSIPAFLPRGYLGGQMSALKETHFMFSILALPLVTPGHKNKCSCNTDYSNSCKSHCISDNALLTCFLLF